MGVSIKGDTPKCMVCNAYFMEKPIKMNELGVPPFQETSIFCGGITHVAPTDQTYSRFQGCPSHRLDDTQTSFFCAWNHGLIFNVFTIYLHKISKSLFFQWIPVDHHYFWWINRPRDIWAAQTLACAAPAFCEERCNSRSSERISSWFKRKKMFGKNALTSEGPTSHKLV